MFATDIPTQLGVQVQPQHVTYQQMRDAVLWLEDLGVDAIFNWDHFFPLFGETDGSHFESWTLLSAWAELTERVQLGALVNCNAYRNPDLQADMARTIDHISGGRFIFGTGSGWFARDFEEYGYDFGSAGSRIDSLGEALPRITARWERLNPEPTRDIPILIGGKGERKTLRLVARHANIWHSFVDASEIPHKLDVLARWADHEGRDIGKLTISNGLTDRDEADADALHATGVRLFTVGFSGPDYNFDLIRNWVKWRDARNGK